MRRTTLSFLAVLCLLGVVPAALADDKDGLTKVTIDKIQFIQIAGDKTPVIHVDGKVYIAKTEKKYNGLKFKVTDPMGNSLKINSSGGDPVKIGDQGVPYWMETDPVGVAGVYNVYVTMEWVDANNNTKTMTATGSIQYIP